MDNFLIAKATDVGVTRQVNEDSMTVFDSPNGQVLAVCDGMGGQAAGDVASQLAVNIIENILTDNTFESPEEAIRRSVLAANQGVLNRTLQNPELEGMGSTCVMLIIKNGRVHCGWVGDSRIYYIANHTIRQISHDQSYVQQLLDSGQISPEEAANHPQKNEIVNCIGLQGMTAPETVAVPIVPEPGSVFLLCSDGLSGMVNERQIERVVSNDKMSLQQKADKLVALANEAGGLDNITVELVQFGTSEAGGVTSGTLFETPKGVNNTKKKSHTLLYSVIALLLLAVLCVGGYFYVTKSDHPKKKTEPTPVRPAENKNRTEDKKDNISDPSPNSSSSSKKSPVKKDPTSSLQMTTPKKKESKGSGINETLENAKNKENGKQVPLQELKEQENPPTPKDVPEVLGEKYGERNN